MKSGYKKTEVAVIPEDWEATQLGSLVSYTNGKAHEQSITESGQFVVVNSKFISTEGSIRKHSDICLCSAAKNDVLMVMSDVPNGRAIAKCYWVEGDNTYTINQRICVLNPRKIDGKLLFYILDRHPFYLGFDDGAKQTNLRKDDVLSVPIIVPVLNAEQRAIAGALSDVDALLGAQEALLAKKRDLKAAAMQQLLTGETRLPGFTGEWDTQLVAELEKRRLVKLSRGKVISKKDIDSTPGDFPIYSSSVHHDGLFGRYGHFIFDEELITWSVDGGGNFFHRPKHKFSVTNVCGFMRVDTSRISYRFFAAHLQLLHSRKSFDYQSKAHPSVVRKEYEVQFPPLPEQTAIAAVLSDMDAEIAALEAQRDKTRALKQGMMQELLTGRIRLV